MQVSAAGVRSAWAATALLLGILVCRPGGIAAAQSASVQCTDPFPNPKTVAIRSGIPPLADVVLDAALARLYPSTSLPYLDLFQALSHAERAVACFESREYDQAFNQFVRIPAGWIAGSLLKSAGFAAIGLAVLPIDVAFRYFLADLQKNLLGVHVGRYFWARDVVGASHQDILAGVPHPPDLSFSSQGWIIWYPNVAVTGLTAGEVYELAGRIHDTRQLGGQLQSDRNRLVSALMGELFPPVTPPAPGSPASQFDGDWYSPDYRYAVRISLSDGKGTALLSNSAGFNVGDTILRITSIAAATMDALHMFTDGRFHPVTLVLLDQHTARVATPSPVGGPNPALLIRRSPPYPGSPLLAAPIAAGLVPSDFDGDWYSPDYRYALRISTGASKGVALLSNSARFAAGDQVLRITSLNGTVMDAMHMFTDGQFHPVTLTLLDHDSIRGTTPDFVSGPNPFLLIRRSPPYP